MNKPFVGVNPRWIVVTATVGRYAVKGMLSSAVGREAALVPLLLGCLLRAGGLTSRSRVAGLVRPEGETA